MMILPQMSGFLPEDPINSTYSIYVAGTDAFSPVRLLASVHEGVVKKVTVHGIFSPRCYSLDLS